MALFLDTRGRTTAGIGICARCSRKFPLEDLMADGNSPGLRVCFEDRDPIDPWRLSPRPPDRITLEYPRPDTPLGFFEDEFTTISVITEAFVPARLIKDSSGRWIVDAQRNAIIASPAGPGSYIVEQMRDLLVTGNNEQLMLTPPNWGTLIGPDGTRQVLRITAPGTGLLWINPTGGIAAPGFPLCEFIAPGTTREALGQACQPTVTYWCDTAGLFVVVRTQ